MSPFNQNPPENKPATEEIYWTGRSSQWKNFKTYAFCVLMLLAVFIAVSTVNKHRGWLLLLALYPAGRALYAWLETRVAEYKLTSQRLIFKYGIFNRLTSEIELYRVKDVLLLEPWYERLVKLGDIKLQTSQRSTPDIDIPAIKKPEELRELIRKTVEQRRTEKGVGEFDTN